MHTFLWGRYAGSTESVLNQDLSLIEDSEVALDRLIKQLRQNRGDLRLQANDFMGWSQGARFYPMLYMLTRVHHAKDWDTGVELSSHLLGNMSRLEVHHIFPKSLLYKHAYLRPEVNAIANFTFLTKETNLLVSDRDPAEYLEKFVTKHPGAVESHWIPMDRNLWRANNYPEFLAARRELLAEAANEFLDSLLAGSVPEEQISVPILERPVPTVVGGIVSQSEEDTILQCNEWVVQQGLPEGEMMYELSDPETGEPMTIIDLAWPNGLQEGYSQPVALLIDESRETEEIVNLAGFRFFTEPDSFRAYVLREVLSVQEDRLYTTG